MYKEHDNKSVISLVGVIILTLLTGFAAWFPAFWFQPNVLNTQGGGTLYRAITPLLDNMASTAPLVTLVVLLALSIWQCWQCANLRLVKTTSLLPILFVLLLAGVFVSEHGVSPGLFASLCVYLAFVQLVHPCSYEDTLWRALETGVLLSTASIFAPTYIFYIPIFWIGMQQLNRLHVAHILASIIGIITPYILLFGFWFLTDNTALIVYQYELLHTQFCVDWLWSMHESILLGIIGIALLVALIGFLHQHTDRIHPRAISSCCFLVAFSALLLSFLYHNAHHSLTLVLFTSLVLTQYFNYRSKKLTTVFFYTLIASLLFVYITQFIA